MESVEEVVAETKTIIETEREVEVVVEKNVTKRKDRKTPVESAPSLAKANEEIETAK